MMGLDDPIHHLGGSNVPNFFSDPSPLWHLIYILAAMIAVFMWYRRRDRKSQIALIATAIITGSLLFISYWFESPREQAIKRVNGVIHGMNQFNTGLAVEHVSDRFSYKGAKKSSLSSAPLNQILRDHQARISAWDFAREDVSYSDNGNAVTIGFCVNVTGSLGSRPGFYVRATCVKDPDGLFRISGFTVHDSALQKQNSPEFVVPGMSP